MSQRATRTTILRSVAAILAAVFLGEAVTWLQGVGIAVTLAALIAITRAGSSGGDEPPLEPAIDKTAGPADRTAGLTTD